MEDPIVVLLLVLFGFCLGVTLTLAALLGQQPPPSHPPIEPPLPRPLPDLSNVDIFDLAPETPRRLA